MDRIKVGEKYGRLTVIENHHPKNYVFCRCECGNLKEVNAYNVFYGLTKSCGCLNNPGNTKHGDGKTRLYKLWKAMKERCNTPSCSCYKHYGARGIKVCKEWENYLVFKEWALANGYSEKLTIDRIDVDGDYKPSNCRWATRKEQANNKTSSHYLTINGERKTIMEWSEISGVGHSTIWARLMKYGWNEYDAVFKPVRRKQVSA